MVTHMLPLIMQASGYWRHSGISRPVRLEHPEAAIDVGLLTPHRSRSAVTPARVLTTLLRSQ